jgi:hypothetical protein
MEVSSNNDEQPEGSKAASPMENQLGAQPIHKCCLHFAKKQQGRI